MTENLPDAMTDDPVAISDLADGAMKAAEGAGIATTEITDEVPSVFDVIAEAMDHREAARLDTDRHRLTRSRRVPILVFRNGRLVISCYVDLRGEGSGESARLQPRHARTGEISPKAPATCCGIPI
ncbi:DUF768 domain-containing protein [Mesorhizobium opportunistum]|uniref:DUF768 domain-containing protein n=1 Tax=Mesorhizobium opportunistum TaxID=593909 RepID=A0ABV1YR24_9HYPH|nr:MULTISPECIES: DUF768 domain-containing protein [Mesorhizobium]WJI40580.1 DUF768 domain-containing protein [Mesorhizobium opportunistum]